MNRRFFPQLNGLRALAILAIVARHYWPEHNAWDPTSGRIGVDLFFVLSGFLVTRSLLLDPQKADESRWAPLGRFFARRAWRIAPLFYLTYLAAILLHWDRSGGGMVWHLSFLSNFYFIREGRFIGACGHLWFIAVLQQFYLVWPLIIAFVPRKRLPEASLGLILIGLFARSLAVVGGWPTFTIDIMTPGAFEALGMGAWLASCPPAGRFRVSLLGIAGLCLLGLRMALEGSLPGTWLSLTGTELWRSLILIWLIAQSIAGLPGWLGRALDSAPAQALGNWSYAIYLSHNFIRCGVGACVRGRLAPAVEPILALLATLAWSAFACRFADIIRPYERAATTVALRFGHVSLGRFYRNHVHRNDRQPL